MSHESAPSIREWLGAAERAAEELASTILGIEDFQITGHALEPPESLVGGYINLNNDLIRLKLGVLTDPEGCLEVTRLFLGMETISLEEQADAWGEIVNILAGTMKRNLDGHSAPIQMGLPSVAKDLPTLPAPDEIAATNLTLGKAKVTLMLVKHQNHGGSNGNETPR
ncbi:MAG: chemotaxis protein CheX [candidate division FCPU426 bacterium]